MRPVPGPYPLGIAPYHLADKLLRCHDPNDVLKALPKISPRMTDVDSRRHQESRPETPFIALN